jgi:hypothetical protein
MEDATPEPQPAARHAFVIEASAPVRPFPHRRSPGAAHAVLERAALEVLAATARAWGLPGRAAPERPAR